MRVQEISELLMFLLQADPFLPTGADTWLEVSILSTSQSTSVPRPTKGRKTWWLKTLMDTSLLYPVSMIIIVRFEYLIGKGPLFHKTHFIFSAHGDTWRKMSLKGYNTIPWPDNVAQILTSFQTYMTIRDYTTYHIHKYCSIVSYWPSILL